MKRLQGSGYGYISLEGRKVLLRTSAELLVGKFPNLTIAGVDCPPFGFDF